MSVTAIASRLGLAVVLFSFVPACFADGPSEADVRKAAEPWVQGLIKSYRYPRLTAEQSLKTFKFVGCKEAKGRVGYVCDFSIVVDPSIGTMPESWHFVKGSNGWERR